MRRIRLPDFLAIKRRRPPTTSPIALQAQFHPLWQNDYYHFKQQLASIDRTNREIARLLQEYHRNSTIFNLKQLESLIKLNCRPQKIDEIDRWTGVFPFTNISPLQNQLENNIVKHFKQSILGQIGFVFAMREQINSVNRDFQERSFMNQSNMSYSVLNMSQNDHMERSFAIKEVQTKIQGLNAILRRMGDIVASQGEHIERIDENLIIGHENVKKGKELLAARAARENCQEEEEGSTCNFGSKVNSVITTLYLVNLALIAIWVIKNL